MSYTVLYRKLRPKNFDEVIGQEHIIQTLKNQFSNNRINHAYLFSGTRGTGKTSTAKIFAKLLNCENPKDLAPCNVCESCKSFNENRNLNTIEIDAASNNGVDDIRNIIDEVKYPPTNGFYKVYIIDEVHMLSIGAFNALLKTLEEPPKYVVFILATTDSQKIPITILSRCQRFDFKRISNLEIVKHIKEYLKSSNIKVEEKALKYIAKLSEGSMRDALSILDQCISFYYDKKITLENVIEMTNSVDDEILFILTEALINFDVKICLAVVEEVVSTGRDILQFTYDIIAHFRNILLVSISDSNTLEFTEDKIESLKKQASSITTENILKYINTFSEAQPFLRQSFNNRIILESCILKLCTAYKEDYKENDFSDISNKIAYLENKLEEIEKNKTTFININEASPKVEKPKEEEEKVKRELAISQDFKKVIENWSEFIENFIKKYNESNVDVKKTIIEEEYQVILKEKAKPDNLEDKFLYIVCENESCLARVNRIKESLKDTLSEVYNKEYNVLPILKKDFDIKRDKVSKTAKKDMSTEEINKDISSKINMNIDFNKE